MGMGNNPMAGMDPAMLQGMLQNPMVQQMMQNLSQNPQMLQQMMQSNPMLQQMLQSNPMMAQMMQDPQMLQMMFNPQMLQNIANMQQGMQGMGGGLPLANAGTQAGAVQPGAPGAGQPNPFADPAMMQMMQQMMGGGAGMGGMGGGAGMGGAGMGGSMEDRFVAQIEQLINMGFADRPSNIQALQMANGDVNQAINFLLGGA